MKLRANWLKKYSGVVPASYVEWSKVRDRVEKFGPTLFLTITSVRYVHPDGKVKFISSYVVPANVSTDGSDTKGFINTKAMWEDTKTDARVKANKEGLVVYREIEEGPEGYAGDRDEIEYTTRYTYFFAKFRRADKPAERPDRREPGVAESSLGFSGIRALALSTDVNG